MTKYEEVSLEISFEEEYRIEGAVEKRELADAVAQLLTKLSPREKYIIENYFGFYGPAKTFKEIGLEWNLTPQRTRAIYEKSLRKLRNPKRFMIIENYI